MLQYHIREKKSTMSRSFFVTVLWWLHALGQTIFLLNNFGDQVFNLERLKWLPDFVTHLPPVSSVSLVLLVERVAPQLQTPAMVKGLDGFRDRGIENTWIFMKPLPPAVPLCHSLAVLCWWRSSQGGRLMAARSRALKVTLDLGLCGSATLTFPSCFSILLVLQPLLYLVRGWSWQGNVLSLPWPLSPPRLCGLQRRPLTEIRCSSQHTSPSHHLPDTSSVGIDACARADPWVIQHTRFSDPSDTACVLPGPVRVPTHHREVFFSVHLNPTS